MRTILIITNTVRDLYVFRRELVCVIVKSGYDVVIVADWKNDDYAAFFSNLGCRIVYTRIERREVNPLRDIALLFSLSKIVKSVNPDLLFSFFIKPNIYGGIAARWHRVPQIAVIAGLGTPIHGGGWLCNVATILYRVGLAKTRRIIYENDEIRVFCEKNKVGNGGVVVTGSGVNLAWYQSCTYPKDDGAPRFLFIGRMMRDKGVNELIAMARVIKSKYPLVEFHLLGELEEELESLLSDAVNDGVVVRHGYVADVRPFIMRSHCIIHPSYHESMSNAVLEACATMRPVITTDVMGCRDAVVDGVSGFICRVKDVEDLISKVERFVNLPYDKKKEMGVAARKIVERSFDRNKVVDTIMGEIGSVVNP